MFACLTSPWIAYFKFRTIINGGFLIMGILMCIVGALALAEKNNALVIVMMLFLATYQWTLGTYAWTYLPQVACDEGLSLATTVLWVTVFAVSLGTGPLFDALGSAGTFFFFAACSLASAVFFFFFLKETKGLSREQTQVIYSKAKGAVSVLDTDKESAFLKNSIGGTTEGSFNSKEKSFKARGLLDQKKLDDA